MDDEEFIDTQWTVAAAAAYEQSAGAFVEAVQRHVSQNLARKGGPAEWGQYFDSTEELRKAALAFENAEFDWCGSFPLGIPDDEDDEDEEDEAALPSNAVLSALGRWDFRIADVDAVMAAGRAAYLRAWPNRTPEDAQAIVQDPENAAGEIVHADGWEALNSTDGLLMGNSWTLFITHEELDDDELAENPFRIAENLTPPPGSDVDGA